MAREYDPSDEVAPRRRTTAHWSDGNVDITGKSGPEPAPVDPPVEEDE